MNVRETAWRLFSEEFNSSTLDISSSEDRAPSYVVTPLGAKVNRLFVVGVITDTENIGSEESPMIRARLADPAGSFYISAGQFQPEATATLRELSPPEFVTVVGKSRVYSPDDSVRLLSIRPEMIRRCDAALRDYWIYETCSSMTRRIDVMREAVKMDPATVQELEALGFPRYLAEGAAAAASHYEKIDLEAYHGIAVDALREIVSSGMGGVREVNVDEMVVSPEAEEVEVSSDDELIVDAEETVLKIIDDMDVNGKGAEWDAVSAAAGKKGIDRERLEEICTDLMDKGDIYEPELGRMKRI